MNFEDDPLQSALATAFSDSHIPQRLPAAPTSSSTGASETEDATSEAGIAEESDEAWRSDYDNLVTGWRAESAISRQKAEQERERWSLIREKEELEEKERIAALGSDHEGSKETDWETVRRAAKTQESTPTSTAEEDKPRSPVTKETTIGVDVMPPSHREVSSSQDVESPESLPTRPDPSISEYGTGRETHGDVSILATAPPSNPDSRTWEEIPSLESSFPSLSFPYRSGAPSPEPRPRLPLAPSVTLAIFDSSLSTRARILAFVSSLAINLFLPFINGMMLGFGEIFARNIVGAFGWKLPGMGVGIRAAPRR